VLEEPVTEPDESSPVHTTPSYSSKVRFNIMLPHKSRGSAAGKAAGYGQSDRGSEFESR
jgi:hypothetical protein